MCRGFALFQAELAQLERSRKAAERSDKQKAKTKARRAAAVETSEPVVPEYIPDCIASAYKKNTKSAAKAKKGKKSTTTSGATTASGSATPSGSVAARSTRRTAREQATYDRTMTALDKLISKSAIEEELEDEEEEEARPVTRGRNKKND